MTRFLRQFFLLSAISALILTASAGCKKLAQSQQPVSDEDLVVIAMTTGKWRMTLFIENGVDILPIWDGFEFQFNTNKTVNAYKNGAVNDNGTWNGNASAMTMTSNFPSNNDPAAKLNGVWNITKNGWSFVEATLSLPGGGTRQLKLVRI